MHNSNQMISPLDVIESARESHSLPPCYQRTPSPFSPEPRHRQRWRSSVPGAQEQNYINSGCYRVRKLSPSSSSNDSGGPSDRRSRSVKKNDRHLHTQYSPQINQGYLLATESGKVMKMSPTGSLGRDVISHYSWEGQPLGIPKSVPISNYGSSPHSFMSQDSVALSGNSESAYGSINSSIRSNSFLDRSSSLDTLNRKEKRGSLKTRVEKMKERFREGSSSEEDINSSYSSSLLGSGNSLNKMDISRKSKNSRTERYLRRKAMELETLRVASEKDKKSREAVLARILEIQKSQKRKKDMKVTQTAKNFLNRLLSGSNSQNQKSKNSKEISVPTIIHPKPDSYGAQRSISYDHNINRSVSPLYCRSPNSVNNINRSMSPLYCRSPNSVTPPAPPPRSSRVNYSGYTGRPVSYSFESIAPHNRGNINSDPYLHGHPKYHQYSHRHSDSLYPNNILKMPPSPSSDYASYLSDNSLRNQRNISPYADNYEEVRLPYKDVLCPSSKMNLPYKQQPIIKSVASISALPSVKSPLMLNKRQVALSSLNNNKEYDSENQENRACINVPEPPRRTTSNISSVHKKYFKQQLDSIKQDKTSMENFRKFLAQERQKLSHSNRAELKSALRELEALYDSLNLESEDILEGAEKREREEQLQARDECDSAKKTKHRKRRSASPDIVKDDLHLRQIRCEQSIHPDILVSHFSGSYLDISPIYGDLPQDKLTRRKSEPNIITDDLSLRFVQKANSLKVIDPQPPFGIPLGPVTQGTRSDYLHPPNYRRRDTKDDLAIRLWRKDDTQVKALSPQPNFAKFDERLLLYTDGSPAHPRCASVDRIHFIEQNNGRRDNFREFGVLPKYFKRNHAAENDLAYAYLNDSRRGRNPSWIERAHLSDDNWDSFNVTSTETLVADSKKLDPDSFIRHGIVSESKFPSAAPVEDRDSSDSDYEFMNRYPKSNPFRVNIRSTSTPPPCKPTVIDYSETLSRPVFNNTPKPFYSAKTNSNVNEESTKTTDKKKKKSISRRNSDKKSPKTKRRKSPSSSNSSPHVDSSPPSLSASTSSLTAISNTGMEIQSNKEIGGGQTSPSRITKNISPPIKGPNGARFESESEKRRRRLEYEKQRLNKTKRKTPEKSEKEPKSTKEITTNGETKSSKTGKITELQTASRISPAKSQISSKASPKAREEPKREAKTSTPSRRSLTPKDTRVKPIVNGSSDTQIKKKDNLAEVSAKFHRQTGKIRENGLTSVSLVKNCRTLANLEDTTKPQESEVIMVQDRQESPLKSIKNAQSDNIAEQEKRNRIQRYKEERRRQMAARYGQVEDGSSSDEASDKPGHASSGAESFAKRRRKPRSNYGPPTDLDAIAGSMTACSSTRMNQKSVTTSSRTTTTKTNLTDAERLRPTSLLESMDSETSCNNNQATRLDNEVSGYRDRGSKPSSSRSPEQRMESTESGTCSGEPKASGVAHSRISCKEKDKSHKRKSHLNRASTSEEAIYPPHSPATQASHLSDSSEDVHRRRRRRYHASSEEPSNPAQTESNSSVSKGATTTAFSDYADYSTARKHSSERSSWSNFKSTGLSKDEPSKHPVGSRFLPDLHKKETKTSGNTGFQLPKVASIDKSSGSDLNLGGSKQFELKSVLKKHESGETCFMASRRSEWSKGLETCDPKPQSIPSSGGRYKEPGSIDDLTHEAIKLKSRVENLGTKFDEKGSYSSPRISPEEAKSDSVKLRSLDPEGIVDKASRRLVFEEIVQELPVTPPYTTTNFDLDGNLEDWEDNETSFTESSSVLKRRSSKSDDLGQSQGILKKSISRNNSMDEKDPKPILKKSSGEEDALQLNDPKKSILKKKSLTDDELESDRPKSILKGSPRSPKDSREDLRDFTESRVSISGSYSTPITPILKRRSLTKESNSYESDNSLGSGELRPILKRRDTTEGIRSIKDESTKFESPSIPPFCRYRRKKSNGNDASGNTKERPLSVLERVAGLEANTRESPQTLDTDVDVSGAVKPKTGTRTPVRDSSLSPHKSEREYRRTSWASSPSNDREGFESPENASSGETSPGKVSKVSQKAAFFSQLGRESNEVAALSSPPDGTTKKLRGTRFTTQPVTDSEVSAAKDSSACLEDSILDEDFQRIPKDSPLKEGSSTGSVASRVAMLSKRLEVVSKEDVESGSKDKWRTTRFKTQPVTMKEVASASAFNQHETTWADRRTGGASKDDLSGFSRRSLDDDMTSVSLVKRRMSAHELYSSLEGGQGENVRGILKSDIRDRMKDGLKGILKSDSRKSSISEGENQPKSILKFESPKSSSLTSPDSKESRTLKSALKKDSSLEDFKGEIKSILKKQSESFEPELSSDESSAEMCLDANESITQTINQTLVDSYSSISVSSNSIQTTESDAASRKQSMQQQVLQDAVKEAQPMKTVDNLAEALRQIEPDCKETDAKTKERRGPVNDMDIGTDERKILRGPVNGKDTGTEETNFRGQLNDKDFDADERKNFRAPVSDKDFGFEERTNSRGPASDKTTSTPLSKNIRSLANGKEVSTSESKNMTKTDILSSVKEVRKWETLTKVSSNIESSRSNTVDASSVQESFKLQQMEAEFEESMKSLCELGQDNLKNGHTHLKTNQAHLKNDLDHLKTPQDKVVFRQKTEQRTTSSDRWTLNDFSSYKLNTEQTMDTSVEETSESSSSPFSSPEKANVTDRGNKDPPSTPVAVPGLKTGLEPAENGAKLSSSGSSINARLASLQKNLEDGWKTRLRKEEPGLASPKGSPRTARPSSLMERVSLLETSSHQWKCRVTQSDATKFTVSHKMASTSQPYLSSSEDKLGVPSPLPDIVRRSPASERKARAPLPKVFKSKTGSCLPDVLGSGYPSKEGSGADGAKGSGRLNKDFGRSVSIPAKTSDEDFPTVCIPKLADEDFESFFATPTDLSKKDDPKPLDLGDLEHVSSCSNQLVVKRRNVKLNRRNRSSANPLKTLSLREDLKEEYTEVVLGLGEKELRRKKVEELSKSSTLAMEALAGLASRENFSAVALKKVDETPFPRELAPYLDLMLIQIKGRRHPQARLVEPCPESINEGDDFLLVTPKELFHYKGRFSNVIERAVASDMALYFLQTKDMGVNAASFKITDVEELSSIQVKNRFWSALGGNSECQGQPPGPPDADDIIEAALIASNKVFRVEGSALVPVEEAWGQTPRYELLASDKVLVFDFGSEVYIWSGKKCSQDLKKCGTELVKDLWKEDYDYSDCDINPIFPPVVPEELVNGTSVQGPRPSWGICGKITENVETILFKEKFVDWPDSAQQTRIKELKSEPEMKMEAPDELTPCDVSEMLDVALEEPDLVLEMSHLGRGDSYYDEEERRLLTISTNDTKVWLVTENEKKSLEFPCSAHLFSAETYVVRWYYHVTASGRTLKGEPSRHNVTGRSRVAYFFWQGTHSSISDKGVSALMTVELDEERGPHVRITMGTEPPAFLNLFDGGLVVHKEKRGSGNSETKELYIVKGERPNEAHLVQVDPCPSHLRSRGCLVAVDISAGLVYLWIGSKTSQRAKQVARHACKKLIDNKATVMRWKNTVSLRLKEQEEGKESTEFWSVLGVKPSQSPQYHCLAGSTESSYDWSTRIWRMEPDGDRLCAMEIGSSFRFMEATNKIFPVLQDEIYNYRQPALFMVDSGPRVYVWQGWIPPEVNDDEEVDGAPTSTTGSTSLRFTFARRTALRTALLYSRKKEERIMGGKWKDGTYNSSDLRSVAHPKLVLAGLESLEFTNLFPMWKSRDDVTKIQMKEGRWKAGQEYSVHDVLEQLSRDRYSLEELRSIPLPDGVDPSRLEKYLSDEDFERTLEMSREAFFALPNWKKLQIKKKAGFF